MGELTAILGLIKNSPTEATLILVALSVVVMLILSSRKVDMEGMTSISKAQTENLKALTEQNRALADDLHKMREHQAKLHEEMNEMREELRKTRDALQTTRMHVQQLEGLLQHYQSRCDGCPNAPAQPIKLAPWST